MFPDIVCRRKFSLFVGFVDSVMQLSTGQHRIVPRICEKSGSLVSPTGTFVSLCINIT